MNMRSVARFLPFLLPVLLLGCASSSGTKEVGQMNTAQQVEWLLSKDLRYANQMDRQRENGVSEEQAVSTYVDRIFGIDLSTLPQDVQTAYHEHRRAWREYERTLSSAPKVDLASLVNLGQALMRLKASGAGDVAAWTTFLSEIESSQGGEVGRRIETTWKEVQNLAVQHEASVEVAPFRYPDEKLVSISEIEAEEGNWDPNLVGIAAPDIRLSVYLGETPACFVEGMDSYTLSPDCSFLVRPSSELKIRVVDDDINEPEVIGEWDGAGEDFLSTRSFDEVRRLVVERE